MKNNLSWFLLFFAFLFEAFRLDRDAENMLLGLSTALFTPSLFFPETGLEAIHQPPLQINTQPPDWVLFFSGRIEFAVVW